MFSGGYRERPLVLNESTAFVLFLIGESFGCKVSYSTVFIISGDWKDPS